MQMTASMVAPNVFLIARRVPTHTKQRVCHARVAHCILNYRTRMPILDTEEASQRAMQCVVPAGGIEPTAQIENT